MTITEKKGGVLKFVTLSGKSSLILGENKAAFRREGYKIVLVKIS